MALNISNSLQKPAHPEKAIWGGIVPTFGPEFLFIRPAFEQAIDKQLSLEKVVHISGKTGIGKRSIVRGYLSTHPQEYRFIVWIRAESMPHLFSSVKKAAKVLGFDTGLSLNGVIEKLQIFLKEHSNSLLVIEDLQVSREDAVIQKLLSKPCKTVLITDETKLREPAIPVIPLDETEAVAIIEKRLQRALAKEELETLRDFFPYLVHSPQSLILLFSYFRLLKFDDPITTWASCLKKAGLSFLTVNSLEKQLLAKILEFGNLNTRKALNVLPYLSADPIPVRLLGLLFQGQETKILYEVLQNLGRMGIVQSPLCDPTLSLEEFAALQQESLSIQVSKRVQQLLRDLQSNGGIKEAFELLNQAKTLTYRKYDAGIHSNSIDENDLLPHVETLLRLSEGTASLDLDLLSLRAKLANSWGRYFQLQEQFNLALHYYERGLDVLKKGESLAFPNRKDSDKLRIWVNLNAEIPHNYGSTCLRVWQQLDEGRKLQAKEYLHGALNKYLQLKVFYRVRSDGQVGAKNLTPEQIANLNEEDYADSHFRYFTLRAYGRVLKASGELSRAREIFNELVAKPEYIQWPRNATPSETLPLALMDQGVIEYLAANKQMSGDLEKKREVSSTQASSNLSGLNIIPLSSTKGNVETSPFPSKKYARAFSSLSQSVALYRDPKYLYTNRKKDLAVALSRLGEFYLAILPYSSPEKISDFTAEADKALRDSLETIEAYKADAKMTHSLALEGRCHYRLAQLYSRQGKYPIALNHIHLALEIQGVHYDQKHPYLEESRLLQTLLEKRQQRGQRNLAIRQKIENAATPNLKRESSYQLLMTVTEAPPEEKEKVAVVEAKRQLHQRTQEEKCSDYLGAANQKLFLVLNCRKYFQILKSHAAHPIIQDLIAVQDGLNIKQTLKIKIDLLDQMVQDLKQISYKIGKKPAEADEEAMKLFRISATNTAENLVEIFAKIKQKLTAQAPEETHASIKQAIKAMETSIDRDTPAVDLPDDAIKLILGYLKK